MHDHYIGPVAHSIAGRFDSAAKVDLFIVEKEVRIEEANPSQRFATRNEKRSRQPIHFRGLIGVCPGAVGSAKDARAGKAGRE